MATGNQTPRPSMAEKVVGDVPRSTLVTAVAWIFIFLSGFAVLIGSLQGLLIFLVFPKAEMTEALNAAAQAGEVPEVSRFMFQYMEWFFVGFLAVSIAALASSIGLLRRKNWARILFVGILGFGVIWNLGGLAFTFSFMDPASFVAGQPAPPAFETMMKIMMWFNVIMALAISALLAWIIRKLTTEPIRSEFLPGS